MQTPSFRVLLPLVGKRSKRSRAAKRSYSHASSSPQRMPNYAPLLLLFTVPARRSLTPAARSAPFRSSSSPPAGGGARMTSPPSADAPLYLGTVRCLAECLGPTSKVVRCKAMRSQNVFPKTVCRYLHPQSHKTEKRGVSRKYRTRSKVVPCCPRHCSRFCSPSSLGTMRHNVVSMCPSGERV